MADFLMRFPGGKKKALTLSYDDGVDLDARLIGIMKEHGLKGTFNLNSGCYSPEGTEFAEDCWYRRFTKKQAVKTYKNSGMEVAVHTLTHPFLDELPSGEVVREVFLDRMNLEKDFGTVIRGMAYPNGTYNDNVVEALKSCGIVYSRTVESTHRFDIPEDWLRLPATCHHTEPELMELAEKFIEDDNYQAQLFYLWGHTFEFERENNWEVIEKFAEYTGNRENIWYATNIEIYDYVKAFKELVFSADGRRIYNPTGKDIYFQYNYTDLSFEYREKDGCVKAGKTVKL